MKKIINSCVILVTLVVTGCRKTSIKYTQKDVISDVLNKPLKTLNCDQLAKVFNYYKTTHDYQKQTACLERMLVISDDSQQIERCHLWLADLYAKQADNGKAYTHYTQYTMLYPGSTHTAYAHMRSISTLFATSLATDRDQSATRSTLGAAQSYLIKANERNYKKYQHYVLSIARECAHKLIEHEVSIINFYMQQANYSAASARLQAVEQELCDLSLLASKEYTRRIEDIKKAVSANSLLVK